jgi:hypothetical protein
MNVFVKPNCLVASSLSWSGQALPINKHYQPYTTYEDALDGIIVESVLCLETGEVTACPPYLTLNNFEGWVRSNFTPSDTIESINLLS